MKSIKKAASGASDAVSIETDYLSRKNRNDFPHSHEVAEKVKVFHAYAHHAVAKGIFESIERIERELDGVEVKAGTEFSGQAATLGNPHNAHMFQQFGQVHSGLSKIRTDYLSSLKSVKEEWSQVISKYYGPASSAQEKINKLLTEVLHYRKVDKHDELSKTENKYNEAVKTFMHAADEYIAALDKGYSEWFERVKVAQITFYQKSAELVTSEWSK